jgi:uncharacterized protein YjbI with pentapeptide repeats
VAHPLFFTLQLVSLLALSPAVPASVVTAHDGAAVPAVAAECSCIVRGSDWSGRDLGFADLSGCDLRDADLSGSRLVGARLQGARLDGADLRGADLRLADLTGASLLGTDLRNADLSSAEIAGAAALDGVRWSGAVCPEETVADDFGGCAAAVGRVGR